MNTEEFKTAPVAAQPTSAPLLVRDLAASLCVQPLAVCEALKEFGFGNFSVNMAVPAAAVKVIESKFAQPQQAKPEPLTADDLKEPKNGKQWRVEWWNESCRMMLPAGSKLDGFVSYKNGTLQFTIKKTAHGIKEQG